MIRRHTSTMKLALDTSLCLCMRRSMTTRPSHWARARTPSRLTEPHTWSPARSYATSSSKSSRTTHAAQVESKLETVPFHLSPEAAGKTLDTAAASSFGLNIVFRLLVSRFLRRFLGIHWDTGVKRLAFRAVLLPTWRVDLAMKGRGLIGEEATQMELNISAVDASIPGFKLPPLHNLTVTSPWASDPVPFEHDKHSKQQGEDVTILPFEMAPIKTLAKIAALPRTTVAKHGIGLDPASFKTMLFAAYPLYLPAYLGEFELDDRRVTAVAFAASERTAFAIYPTFIPEPAWLPRSTSVEMSVAGAPVDFSAHVPSNSLASIRPKLDELLTSIGGSGAMESGEKMFAIADPCERDEWESDAHVMRYSLNAGPNREYIDSIQQLASAEAMTRQVDSLDDNVRGIVITSRGPKMASRDVLLADSQKKLVKAKRLVTINKPEWLTQLEERKRANAAKGHGRGR